MIKKGLLQPLFFASGVTISLYLINDKLPSAAYLTIFPFYPLIARPLGIFWSQKFLKKINEGVFPKQMLSYREMYLFSRRAILYDIILNHSFYQPLYAAILLTYNFYTNKYLTKYIQNNQNKIFQNLEQKSLLTVFKQNAIPLLRTRALLSIISIVSQNVVSSIVVKKLEKKKQALQIPTQIKRMLLFKQLIINLSWNLTIFKRFNQTFYNQRQKAKE